MYFISAFLKNANNTRRFEELGLYKLKNLDSAKLSIHYYTPSHSKFLTKCHLTFSIPGLSISELSSYITEIKCEYLYREMHYYILLWLTEYPLQR